MDKSDLIDLREENRLVRQMEAVHALHGDFAKAYEILGGVDYLVKLGEKSPVAFIQAMTKMAPSAAPTSGQHGDVKIIISDNLGRSVLDGEVAVEADFEDALDE